MGTNVFLGAESLRGGSGGIARVARLVARVLGEEVQTGRLCGRCVVLSDPQPCGGFPFPVRTARGGRLRFLWETHKAAFGFSHFLYDFLGLARAHCRLPYLRRPFLAWMHGLEVWEAARPAWLKAARRADILVSNSAFTRERAASLHGGFAQAHVCWLGTESDEPLKPQRKTSTPPTVLIIGRVRLDRDKGHTALIDAWPKVVAAVPDARLLMVGTGPDLAHFQQKAAASPVAPRIEVRGFVPDEKMEDVWSEATLFAMPSRGEGFGLVYIEAMRHSLPVIASVHDAAPEINIEGETGYNVDLEKREELPERIIYLLKNPEQAAALGRGGESRWAKHFSYSAFKARFLPLLAELLDR